MLSKFLILAFGALALIDAGLAVPSQTSFQSCSINQAETTPVVKHTQTIVPGKYKINNIAFGTESFRSRFLIGDWPIFLPRSAIPAGSFEEWMIEECEASLTYTIANIGFKASVYASKGEILVGHAQPGDCWYLERIGASFLIKVPGQAMAWTVDKAALLRSNVQVKPQRWSTAEVWNLTKIET
ncbi:hypothetical protein C8R45DRAFT_1084244 [Mycena sanguinolenta]|nr:hypothetical protein C8R45DRAFT_1084244 [Mycena sanguinolenta]